VELQESACLLIYSKDIMQHVLITAGIELISLPVAAVFWLQYEKNVDNSYFFSCCYVIKDCSQFLISQVCRSCEGAQTDRQPSWPVEIFHTMGVMLIL